MGRELPFAQLRFNIHADGLSKLVSRTLEHSNPPLDEDRIYFTLIKTST